MQVGLVEWVVQMVRRLLTSYREIVGVFYYHYHLYHLFHLYHLYH